MAFRRAGSNCKTSAYVLEGLNPDATYTVTDIDTKEAWELSGKVLTTEGLSVTIPEKYQSKILLYRIRVS